MEYSEFEEHLQENPKCHERVKDLREEGSPALEDVDDITDYL